MFSILQRIEANYIAAQKIYNYEYIDSSISAKHNDEHLQYMQDLSTSTK